MGCLEQSHLSDKTAPLFTLSISLHYESYLSIGTRFLIP